MTANLHEKTGLINFTADLEYFVEVRVNCRRLHEEMEVPVDSNMRRLRVVVLCLVLLCFFLWAKKRHMDDD